LATLQVDLGPVVTGRDEDPTESQSRRLLLLPRAKGGPRAVRLSEHAIGLLNKTGEGFFLDIALGIVGAVVGGWLFSLFGMQGVTGLNIFSLIVALIGAVVFLVIYHAIRRTV
jgi:uncharacterized membrane protein YeaQ/YmgE (transglycosylase-associated protein family)